MTHPTLMCSHLQDGEYEPKPYRGFLIFLALFGGDFEQIRI